MILALEKEQWSVVASESAQHFTHDNGMITAFVTLHNLALEMADGAVQDSGAVTAFVPGQAGKLIGALGGKATRDLLLIFVEKVYCKYVGLNEARIALCSLVDANQDQRRIERQRCKRVGREAERRAGIVFCGDDGDAGGKVTEDSAQL